MGFSENAAPLKLRENKTKYFTYVWRKFSVVYEYSLSSLMMNHFVHVMRNLRWISSPTVIHFLNPYFFLKENTTDEYAFLCMYHPLESNGILYHSRASASNL